MNSNIKQEFSNIKADLENLLLRESKKEPIDNINEVAPRIINSLILIKESIEKSSLDFDLERKISQEKAQAIAETYKNNLILMKEDFDKKLTDGIQEAKTKAYEEALVKIGNDFINKIRCAKCGNNRISIKHDYRLDILICNCSICNYEWDRDPLDKVKK